jgi:hypothetical protein
VSQYILDRQGFKSTISNSARPIPLTPAEKARRVAALRALLRAPAFQVRMAAECGRVTP